MRVQFVANNDMTATLTDAHGIVRWTRSPRPVFALAQWGNSYAFLSLLPQAPLPSTIVGVRTDSAVVHAGENLRVVGFARSREGNALRPSRGTALVSLRIGAVAIGEQRVALDNAGAFVTSFAIPQAAKAGDYAVLAQAGGGIGGATVHVDANAGGLSLEVGVRCGGPCDSQRDVPLQIRASRGGTLVHVTVVRSPHVYLGYAPERRRGQPPRGSTSPCASATMVRRSSRFRIPTTSLRSPTAFGSNRRALPPTRASSCRPPAPPMRVHVDRDGADAGDARRLRRLRRRRRERQTDLPARP